MTNPKDLPKPFGDLAKPHETVAEPFSDGLRGDPLTVQLGELWCDFVRVVDEGRDSDAPSRSPSGVPLLDDMKGILQWD